MNFYPELYNELVIDKDSGTTYGELRRATSSWDTVIGDYTIYSKYLGTKSAEWSGDFDNRNNHIIVVSLNVLDSLFPKGIAFDYWASIDKPHFLPKGTLTPDKRKEHLSVGRIYALKAVVDEGSFAYDSFVFEDWCEEAGYSQPTMEAKRIFDASLHGYQMLWKFLGRDHKKVKQLHNDLSDWEQWNFSSRNRERPPVWHLDHEPIVKEYP